MSRVNMSYASEKLTPLASMVALGPKLLIETVKSMSGFIEQAIDTSVKLPRALSIIPLQTCGIPEIDCPPRCVCQITWEASNNERLQCKIKVTNSSDNQRLFTIRALPFPNPAGTIQISPDRISLAPGETGLAVASYAVPAQLSPGTYKTEILVTGAYEQCISIILEVIGTQQCECHVVQGEIPKKIHAHHWYDHFQCEDPCFKPAGEPQKR